MTIKEVEKGVILDYLGWTDKDGNLYDPKKSALCTGYRKCYCCIGTSFNTFFVIEKRFCNPG